MRCYLEVPIQPYEESRQDLCPCFCPAFRSTGGENLNDPVEFWCGAGRTYDRPLPKKLEYVLIEPEGKKTPGWFEVKRRADCPIKTSATPVW